MVFNELSERKFQSVMLFKKGTPPRFEMDWKAPEDSVSHGLCKQWWGGVPNQFIKSVHV